MFGYTFGVVPLDIIRRFRCVGCLEDDRVVVRLMG